MTLGEYPVNIGREISPDTRFTASHDVLPWMNFIYKWLIVDILKNMTPEDIKDFADRMFDNPDIMDIVFTPKK